MNETETETISGRLKLQLKIISFFLIIFWLSEIIDQWILNDALNQYGIVPRTVVGLRGVVLSPFLHGDFTHLMANTLPFLVLSWLVLLSGAGTFFFVLIAAMVIGGMGTWLFGGSQTIHLGASGLIFGFLGFLLARGVFERTLKTTLLAVAVGVVYGGVLWGVFPGQPGVSWQGHLFGLLGGVAAARLLTRRKRGIEV